MSLENQDESLTQRVMTGIGWSYVSTFLKVASQIVFLAVLSRLLTPRDFGLIGMALVFTNLAERLGQLGLGPALIQMENAEDRFWKTGRTMSLALGAAATLLIWMSAPLVADFYDEQMLVPILRLLSFIFVFESICIVPESWLTRNLRFRQLAGVENASYFAGYCLVALPCAFAGYGVWSLVFSQLTIRAVKYGMLCWLSRPPEGFLFSNSAVRSLLKVGSGFTLGRLLNFAASQGDNLVVGKQLGADSLGLYVRIYQLMTLPAIYVAQVLDKVLFPALAMKQRNPRKVGEGMLMLVEVVAMVSLPIAAVCATIPREIILLLFGPQWDEADRVLQIFAIGVFFRAGYKCGDTVIRSLGAVYRYSALQAVYSSAVVLGAYLGSFSGLEGVAWAVLSAVILNYIMMSLTALRMVEAPISAFLRAHLPGIWVGAASLLACTFVESMTKNRDLAPAVVVGLSVLAVMLVYPLAIRTLPNAIFPRVIPFFFGFSGVRRLLERAPFCSRVVRVLLGSRFF